ncbi:branched-chain amino acid transport system permease protein [Palleronia aestuarii]|uniref:Branched-chain amino acid transport system permease protein n=1 Tax=Palleronia aestuarii TaxID=568105 RepID=A0A2W7MRM2_9RHOB|nr:branched-chain amino acid ABC transporter permease [Palleronia aestuarii]PZX10558.1 branched-chain amino acid transport system permease protein [Palleronia aestuarii]
MDTTAFLQNVSNGFLIGGVYALIGIGLTLVFGVMRTINFAHGDFTVLGMYGAVAFNSAIGWDPYAALIVAVPAAFIGGVLIERFVLSRLVEAPPETTLLATLGLSLIIGNCLLLIWGPEPESVNVPYAATTLAVGSVRVSVVLLAAGLMTLAAITALWLFLSRTETGRAVKATASNRLGAELVGIDTRRIHSLVFGLGTSLAVIAGVALIPLLFANPTNLGPIFTLKAFVVTVLGGLGNVWAAIAGGLILGIVEVLGTAYLASEYRDAYGLIVFLAILLLRPEGLFGRTTKRA